MSLIVLLAFAFGAVGIVVYLVTLYNGLVALKNDIDKAWANIDVLLKQRHDELTKLLDTTKGYMNFERDTLTKITQARSQYQQAVTFDQKAQADQSMTSALRGFFCRRGKLSRSQGQREFHGARAAHIAAGKSDRRPP